MTRARSCWAPRLVRRPRLPLRDGSKLPMMRPLLVWIVLASSIAVADAQRGGPPAPQTPRLAASIDVTGYWVPLITEDWRYRVVTPPAGDYTSIPMSPAARKIAASWEPGRDEAAGEQCRGYGVGGVMR